MTEQTPHVLAELSSYLDGKMSSGEKRRVEAHIAGCESCRRHEHDLRALRDLIHETPSLIPKTSLRDTLSRPLLIAIAVIGVAALAFWALHGRSQTPSMPETPVTSVVEHPKPARVEKEPPVEEKHAEAPLVKSAPPTTAQPPADTSIPALQELANTAPSPSTATAPVENTNPSTGSVAAPDNTHP